MMTSVGGRDGQHRWRLAVCLSHPTQYKAPLLWRLARHPCLDLQVYFYSDTGLVQKPNRYHGMTVAWDVPLLEGYSYEFLSNQSPGRRWMPAGVGPYLNVSLLSRLVCRRYDAVIIHSYLYPSDWLAWLAAKAKRIPVLFYGDLYPRSKCGLKEWLRHRVASVMLAGCGAYLAIGSMAVSVYLDEYRRPVDKVFLAPYAVDNDLFMAASALWRPRQAMLKTDLGIPPDVPVVLCVAGMVPKKHQVDLVEAMARLKAVARLVLVGHGPLLEEVRSFCQQRLPDTILTGFVNQTELPRYYAMADIFVLPSLWEEFGLVVNEAMCFGLPVITSDAVAASRDLVQVGENGYTFPPCDIDALSARLEPLLRSADLRQRFGQRSREIIASWNYDKTIAGILKALESVKKT